MKPRHLVPFAILLAWQAAPVRVDSTPSSPSFALSLGYGLAQFEDATFDCNGNFVSAERVEIRSAGARADMLTSGGLRVTGFGGKTTSNRLEGDRTFVGVQLAYEGRKIGVGAGMTSGLPWAVGNSSTAGNPTMPNFYLRLGRADGVSYRTELLPPSEQVGVTSYLRSGVDINSSRHQSISAYLGLSLDPFAAIRGFADFTIPATRSLDVLLRGEVGGGHQYTPYSLGLGARYRFADSR